LGVQASSAISAQLFPALGVAGTTALRFLIGAVVLLVIFRPAFRGRGRRDWTRIVIYGLSMAAMTLCLYLAVSRLPLGVAVTLEFLGPCTVALIRSRRLVEGACAVMALAGVALIAGPGGTFDLIGYLGGLGAAGCFGLYTVLTERVGKSDQPMGELALSVAVAALASAALIPRSAQIYDWRVIGLVVASAVVGIVMPYAVDTLAARVSSARVVGTLFAIDPVMGLLIGWLALGQHVPLSGVAGVALVAAAGGLMAGAAAPAKPDPN
jgi:inner membrane transporter RhtA